MVFGARFAPGFGGQTWVRLRCGTGKRARTNMAFHVDSEVGVLKLNLAAANLPPT